MESSVADAQPERAEAMSLLSGTTLNEGDVPGQADDGWCAVAECLAREGSGSRVGRCCFWYWCPEAPGPG